MRYKISYVPAALLIFLAAAHAGPPGLDVRVPDAVVRNMEQLTRIPFSIRGSYSGDVEFFQFKSVRYFKTIKQKTEVSVEYEADVPAVFESVPFNIRAGSVSQTLGARRMDIISGVDPEISRLFGRAEIEFEVRLKAVIVAALYLICIIVVLNKGGRWTIALAAITIFFSATEVFLFKGEAKQMSVTLHEGKTGGVPHSYEFIGVGCPFGGSAGLARQTGVIFPVHETIQGLLGDDLRIELVEEGSRVKKISLERGTYRIFCSISKGGLGGEVALRGGEVVNMTGFDVAGAFLWKEGRLFGLGTLPNGGRSDVRSAEEVSKEDALGEMGERLTPAALRLLSWRINRLGSESVVFGFISSSRVLFFTVIQKHGNLYSYANQEMSPQGRSPMEVTSGAS